MKRVVALVLFLGLVVAASAQTDEKLIRLETHLEKIRQEYAYTRVLGGGGLMVAGAFIAGAGSALSYYYLPDGDSPGIVASRNIGIAVSAGYGAVLFVPGVLMLALKPDYETMPEQFARQPESTADEVRDKIVRGEVTLQSLADKARFERFLTAGLLGIGGGVSMYLAAMTQATYGDLYGPPSIAIDPNFSTGVSYLALAVLRFVLDSTPENENKTYLQWKASL